MAYSSLIANTFSVGTSGGGTTPAIDTTGADIIFCGVVYSTGFAPTLTDSKSNSWTPVGSAQESISNGCQLFICQGGTVGAGHTFTVTGTTSFASVFVEAFSGSAASPTDQITGSQGNGFSRDAGSITPSENNEIIIAIFVNFGSDAGQSMDSGMTLTDTQSATVPTWGSSMGYKIQTTATAIDVIGTSDSSNNNAIQVASFKAANTDTNVDLDGVTATGEANSLISNSSPTLAGISAAGAAGTLSLEITSNISLTGVNGTGAVGTLTFGIGTDVPLVSAVATGLASAIASSNATVSLSGVDGHGSAGQIASTNLRLYIFSIGTMRDTLPVDALMSDTEVPSQGAMSNTPVAAIGTLLAA